MAVGENFEAVSLDVRHLRSHQEPCLSDGFCELAKVEEKQASKG